MVYHLVQITIVRSSSSIVHFQNCTRQHPYSNNLLCYIVSMVSIINMRIFKVTLVIVVGLLSNFINATPASFLRLEHRTIDDDAPSLPLDNADLPEVTSITSVNNDKDTYDQRQNGTENYRIHVKGLVVLLAPIESLFLAGGNLGGANDFLGAMGESSMMKPKPKPDESKPIVPVVENATDIAKPEEPEKKLAQRPHLRFASLIAPLLKRVAIH